jgi:putative ABC transport system ATP-binding protein
VTTAPAATFPAAAPGTAPAVQLVGVTRIHPPDVRALDGVDLVVPRGSFLAVMGPSGSGKSTLLHCAAGLDTPTGGQVLLGGREIGRLDETRRTELRREHVGFVFQAYNLLPALSVADNVTLPLRLAGRAPDLAWVRFLLDRVGLGGHLGRRPGELSGGQQQRAAIARALVARPAVVFADEPTGALDRASAGQVLGLLRELVDELGQTVVMVTHDPAGAAHADRALVMADGRVVEAIDSPTAAGLAGRLSRGRHDRARRGHGPPPAGRAGRRPLRGPRRHRDRHRHRRPAGVGAALGGPCRPAGRRDGDRLRRPDDARPGGRRRRAARTPSRARRPGR